MEFVKTCGHSPEGSYEDEGCIDGLWYGLCSSEYCYGMCEYQGDCGCPGCDSPKCCMNGEK